MGYFSDNATAKLTNIRQLALQLEPENCAVEFTALGAADLAATAAPALAGTPASVAPTPTPTVGEDVPIQLR